MRRFKSFLLILLALWLPLQTAAAAAMPFCRHAAERQLALEAQESASAMPTHCHEHAAMAHDDQVPTPDEQASFDAGCDNCEMCHLASSGFLLTAASEALPMPTASIQVAGRVLAPPSHISEPPQHPPRRTN